jgi:NAD(P)-dependent dehydrogenase (short-subunit alcohol dehydrogenase family)
VVDVQNKVSVVTGGGSGIGRGVALALTRNGAKAVVIADIDEAGARETASQVEAAGGTALVQLADMEQPEQISELMRVAAETYGSLDVLVNNVGVHETYWTDQTTVDKLPLEVFERVYRINLRSVFLATQAAVPYMRESDNDPVILNAASTGAFTGYPGAAAYGSTKAAIMQFTRVSAVDLSPKIRVNAYAPGTVDTAMVQRMLAGAGNREDLERTMTATHLIPRMGTAEDIGNLVAFLASREAKWLTGVTYLADGGSLAWRGSN